MEALKNFSAPDREEIFPFRLLPCDKWKKKFDEFRWTVPMRLQTKLNANAAVVALSKWFLVSYFTSASGSPGITERGKSQCQLDGFLNQIKIFEREIWTLRKAKNYNFNLTQDKFQQVCDGGK